MPQSERDLIHYQALTQVGLSINQAKLYEALVRAGPRPASEVAHIANVPRTLAYKALTELADLGLVEKDDRPGAVARFVPAHPFKVRDIAQRRFEESRHAKEAVGGVLSKLISDFNTRSGTPGVRILEGVDGFSELLEDELNERQSIRLIWSPQISTLQSTRDILNRHLEEQIRLGVRVRVIGPLWKATKYQEDAKRLTERRIIPPEIFAIPAMITIYANKVAITSCDPLITTLIENEPIRLTFETIFEYIWKLSEDDHKKVSDSIVGGV